MIAGLVGKIWYAVLPPLVSRDFEAFKVILKICILHVHVFTLINREPKNKYIHVCL